MELLSGRAKSSHVVSNDVRMAEVRQYGRVFGLFVVEVIPFGLCLILCGWYRCMNSVSSWVQSVVG